MRSSLMRRVLLFGALLFVPSVLHAQEAALTGTVNDSTGAVLPGVTVQAVHEASGNTFEAVTDARGIYRIPARTGIFRVRAELSGFTPVVRTGIELLVGQTVTVNLQLAPGVVSEAVTVTAEAPLINTITSNLGGNVDPRQVQELPRRKPLFKSARPRLTRRRFSCAEARAWRNSPPSRGTISFA